MRRGAVVAVIALLVAVACGGSGSEVRVLVAGDPEELAAYRELVAAFHASQDDVRVRLEEVTDRDELLARLATSIASGRPPDVFLLNYRYVGRFVGSDAIVPLDGYLEASGVLDPEAFFDTPLEAFRFEGRQMCLPQNAASLVVYYNADLFDQAGVAPPRGEWTWDEMVEAASALTRDTDGDGAIDVYGLGVEPELLRVAPMIWSNGGQLVDDALRPTRLAVRSTAALGALRRFLELRKVHEVTPPELDAESEPAESRFTSGRLAMLMDSRRIVPTLRAAATFEWDVAPLPTLREPATVLHADGYCLTAGSERADDAWTFLEFALGPRGQRVTALAGRTVPSLAQVARSEVFLDPDEPPRSSQVFLDQLDVARQVPATAAWPRVEDAADAVLEEAYYEPGRVEAAEVALALLQATRGAFAEGAG